MSNEEMRAAYEAETGETVSDYDATYFGDSDGETVSGTCRTCGAVVDVTTWDDGMIVRTDANGAEHEC
jgi:hypothetical protein